MPAIDHATIKIIRESANQLMESVENGLNLKFAASDLYNLRWQIYAKLEEHEKESFNRSIPWISIDTISGTTSTTLAEDIKQNLLHSINRFVIWLDCHLQNYEEQIGKLKTDLAEVKQKNELLNKRSKDLLTIIVNAKNDLSFAPKKEDYGLNIKNVHLIV